MDHHGSHAWRDQQCLPVAEEVAVHHTVVVVVHIVGVPAAVHIAGVAVVARTDRTVVANCLAVVVAAVVAVVVGSSLVDSSFVLPPG